MKKVILMGTLMILSGSPNIYASDLPMESENMSMGSRDLYTSSLQSALKKRNIETLGVQKFTDIVIEKFFKEVQQTDNAHQREKTDILIVLSHIKELFY